MSVYDIVHARYSDEVKEILYGVSKGKKFENARFEQTERIISIPEPFDDNERYAAIMELLEQVFLGGKQ